MKGSIIAKIAVRFVTAISTTGGKDEQHQYRKPLEVVTRRDNRHAAFLHRWLYNLLNRI